MLNSKAPWIPEDSREVVEVRLWSSGAQSLPELHSGREDVRFQGKVIISVDGRKDVTRRERSISISAVLGN